MRVPDEMIRAALPGLGVQWKRATIWITSPDLEHPQGKRPATEWFDRWQATSIG